MRLLFDRKPDREAEIFAEACSLLDDGLDEDFVLSLYPDDADWLGPQLSTASGVTRAIETEQPSFFFEASLKSKFLAAGREAAVPAAAAPTAYGRVSPARTAVASASVALAAGILGILSFGFVTADHAVPGDWNYSFKRAQERIEYALARGDARVNVQIDHTQERVQEIQARGDSASASDIRRLESDLSELEDLARQNDLDAFQRAELEALYKQVKTVLANVSEKQAPPQVVRNAEEKADRVIEAAGLGGGSAPPPITVTPAPTEPTPPATVEPTDTATATATETATETPTEEPSETATPTASETQPLESATPDATAAAPGS
jgi:hypothetical protein